jgi:DNA repair exonuclease SbcCD ATPase subunit
MTKNRKEAVNYELFMKTVDAMTAEGQTPSVRVIRSLIGGSNSTLLECLRRWRSETSTLAPADDAVSEPFKQALRAEMGRVARTACQGVETQLIEEKRQAEEARSLLKETETRFEELESQYQAEQEQAAKNALSFEKQLAARDEQVAELRRQIDKLEARFKEATKLAHEMEIRAAVAESRVTDLEKSGHQK